jgi:predicted site-specific integrase-resolvase
MESIKVDRTKLLKVSSFAKVKGVDRQTVYLWIKEGKIKPIDIDGVKFIQQ